MSEPLKTKKNQYIKELEEKAAWLEKEILEARNLAAALNESEEKYRLIAETSSDGIYHLDTDGKVTYASPAAEKLFGWAPGEALGTSFTRHIHASGLTTAKSLFQRVLQGEMVRTYELTARKKDNTTFCMEVSASPLMHAGKIIGLQGISRDVDKRKADEEALRQKDREIALKNLELEEVNKALKKLIRQKEEEWENILRRILDNVHNFVKPYLRQLKDSGITDIQRVYVNVIETNLSEITSPFSGKLGKKFDHLTDREIEVANLIRMGKTSKEIALFLHTSKRSVDFHRNRLRDKLGIRNRKYNLKQYLQSLAD